MTHTRTVTFNHSPKNGETVQDNGTCGSRSPTSTADTDNRVTTSFGGGPIRAEGNHSLEVKSSFLLNNKKTNVVVVSSARSPEEMGDELKKSSSISSSGSLRVIKNRSVCSYNNNPLSHVRGRSNIETKDLSDYDTNSSMRSKKILNMTPSTTTTGGISSPSLSPEKDELADHSLLPVAAASILSAPSFSSFKSSTLVHADSPSNTLSSASTRPPSSSQLEMVCISMKGISNSQLHSS